MFRRRPHGYAGPANGHPNARANRDADSADGYAGPANGHPNAGADGHGGPADGYTGAPPTATPVPPAATQPPAPAATPVPAPTASPAPSGAPLEAYAQQCQMDVGIQFINQLSSFEGDPLTLDPTGTLSWGRLADSLDGAVNEPRPTHAAAGDSGVS